MAIRILRCVKIHPAPRKAFHSTIGT